jgi:hypothetical protein
MIYHSLVRPWHSPIKSEKLIYFECVLKLRKTKRKEVGKMARCGYMGCEKQATTSVSFDYDTVVSYCEEHAKVVMQELEKQRKERWEREERQLEAKRQASKILYTESNEIFFTVREYEGRPETYVTLGKKVPYDVYKSLVNAGALVKEKDPEDGNIYYIIKDEQKAAQVLAKYGYKAILSKEWQARLDKAAEILRQAGVDPTYLYLKF